MDMIRFGQMVRSRRKLYRMPREQLAEKTDLSTSTIRNIENGSCLNPGVDTVSRIAEVLNIPMGLQSSFSQPTLSSTMEMLQDYVAETPPELLQELLLKIVSLLHNYALLGSIKAANADCDEREEFIRGSSWRG